MDGTQALAIVAGAAAVAATKRSTGLADAAVPLWGIGVALYAALTFLIVLRLLTARSILETFAATYWILLAATAISVLARTLQLPPNVPILTVTGAVVSGTSYLLRAFGARHRDQEPPTRLSQDRPPPPMRMTGPARPAGCSQKLTAKMTSKPMRPTAPDQGPGPS